MHQYRKVGNRWEMEEMEQVGGNDKRCFQIFFYGLGEISNTSVSHDKFPSLQDSSSSTHLQHGDVRSYR
jgi:hypothetical protein